MVTDKKLLAAATGWLKTALRKTLRREPSAVSGIVTINAISKMSHGPMFILFCLRELRVSYHRFRLCRRVKSWSVPEV